MTDKGNALTRFYADVMKGVPESTQLLGAVLLAILVYMLFRTLTGSRSEIRKG